MDQDEKDRDEYEVLREQVSNNTIPSTTRMGPAWSGRGIIHTFCLHSTYIDSGIAKNMQHPWPPIVIR